MSSGQFILKGLRNRAEGKATKLHASIALPPTNWIKLLVVEKT